MSCPLVSKDGIAPIGVINVDLSGDYMPFVYKGKQYYLCNVVGNTRNIINDGIYAEFLPVNDCDGQKLSPLLSMVPDGSGAYQTNPPCLNTKVDTLFDKTQVGNNSGNINLYYYAPEELVKLTPDVQDDPVDEDPVIKTNSINYGKWLAIFAIIIGVIIVYLVAHRFMKPKIDSNV